MKLIIIKNIDEPSNQVKFITLEEPLNLLKSSISLKVIEYKGYITKYKRFYFLYPLVVILNTSG